MTVNFPDPRESDAPVAGSVPDFGFEHIANDGKARLGLVTTAHGQIRTPAFMPVGTQATVKTMYRSRCVSWERISSSAIPIT